MDTPAGAQSSTPESSILSVTRARLRRGAWQQVKQPVRLPASRPAAVQAMIARSLLRGRASYVRYQNTLSKARDGLDLVWTVILCGELTMLQVPMCDGLSLDPFALLDDGRRVSKTSVGGRDFIEAHSIRQINSEDDRINIEGRR